MVASGGKTRKEIHDKNEQIQCKIAPVIWLELKRQHQHPINFFRSQAFKLCLHWSRVYFIEELGQVVEVQNELWIEASENDPLAY